MTQRFALPPDDLAPLAPAPVQVEAARLAQTLFTRVFRQAASAEAPDISLEELQARCQAWCEAGATPQARSLRLALLLSGLDQWGVAFSRAFGIGTIPALTALIGALRTRLDAPSEARLQQHFEQIDAAEGHVIDFKIELRRRIHLALWHAIGAGADLESVQPILQTLGSLLLSLDGAMPMLGGRLVADTLAHIQIRLLEDRETPALAQAATRLLLASLREALPPGHYEQAMAYATRAVLDWQHARRPH